MASRHTTDTGPAIVHQYRHWCNCTSMSTIFIAKPSLTGFVVSNYSFKNDPADKHPNLRDCVKILFHHRGFTLKNLLRRYQALVLNKEKVLVGAIYKHYVNRCQNWRTLPSTTDRRPGYLHLKRLIQFLA